MSVSLTKRCHESLEKSGWIPLKQGIWCHPQHQHLVSLAGLDNWTSVQKMTSNNQPVQEISMNPIRTVMRVQPSSSHPAIYVKQHLELPQPQNFTERIGSTPVPSDAWREWQRLHLFKKANIHTQTAVVIGWQENSAQQPHSFLGTLEVQGLPLEQLFYEWQQQYSPLDFQRILKTYIKRVAHLTRQMHQAGLNHQDWYLGHIFETGHPEKSCLYVIDLQRAQIHSSLFFSLGRKIKDLAQLDFSADPRLFDFEDRKAFLESYWQTTSMTVLQKMLSMWIHLKSRKIRHHNKKITGLNHNEFFCTKQPKSCKKKSRV